MSIETLLILVPGFDLGNAEGDARDLYGLALDADEGAAGALAVQFSPKRADEVTALPMDVATVLSDLGMDEALRADEQAAHELEASTW